MIHSDIPAAAEYLAGGEFSSDAATAVSVTDALYSWYVNRSPLAAQGGPVLPYEVSLSDALRAAHAGSVHFAGGWRAETVSTWGRAVASAGELTRMLERSEYSVPTRHGLRAEPGDPLVVSQCWDWVEEENGFWYTRRGEWPPPESDRLIRVYWNCPPSAAPALVGGLTAALAHHPHHPYTIKTLAAPNHHGRSDGLVLYLGPEGYVELEAEVVQTATDLADQLREPTPRFTALLAKGVALAEGPIGGDSFGQSRAMLIAAAYEGLEEATRTDTKAIAGAIEESFLAAGLDPERPYLEPQPERDYV